MEEGSQSMKPIHKKRIRNQEILMSIASGASKDDLCITWNLSLSQLNRILCDANKETEEWYKSLPRKTMIQIFRFNSEKIFNEIQVLEKIRNSVSDPVKKFEMTKSVINAYTQYNKLVSEGPSLIRQKEITEEAEKMVGQK